MAKPRNKNSNYLVRVGIILGLSLIAAGALTAALLINPLLLPAIIGFTLAASHPFSFLAAASIGVQIAALSGFAFAASFLALGLFDQVGNMIYGAIFRRSKDGKPAASDTTKVDTNKQGNSSEKDEVDAATLKVTGASVGAAAPKPQPGKDSTLARPDTTKVVSKKPGSSSEEEEVDTATLKRPAANVGAAALRQHPGVGAPNTTNQEKVAAAQRAKEEAAAAKLAQDEAAAAAAKRAQDGAAAAAPKPKPEEAASDDGSFHSANSPRSKTRPLGLPAQLEDDGSDDTIYSDAVPNADDNSDKENAAEPAQPVFAADDQHAQDEAAAAAAKQAQEEAAAKQALEEAAAKQAQEEAAAKQALEEAAAKQAQEEAAAKQALEEAAAKQAQEEAAAKQAQEEAAAKQAQEEAAAKQAQEEAAAKQAQEEAAAKQVQEEAAAKQAQEEAAAKQAQEEAAAKQAQEEAAAKQAQEEAAAKQAQEEAAAKQAQEEAAAKQALEEAAAAAPKPEPEEATAGSAPAFSDTSATQGTDAEEDHAKTATSAAEQQTPAKALSSVHFFGQRPPHPRTAISVLTFAVPASAVPAWKSPTELSELAGQQPAAAATTVRFEGTEGAASDASNQAVIQAILDADLDAQAAPNQPQPDRTSISKAKQTLFSASTGALVGSLPTEEHRDLKTDMYTLASQIDYPQPLTGPR